MDNRRISGMKEGDLIENVFKEIRSDGDSEAQSKQNFEMCVFEKERGKQD